MARSDLQRKGADKVLEFIVNFSKTNGYAPTLREIGDALGIKSSSTVCYIMNYLEREGYIKTIPNKSRIIIILEETWHGGEKISKKAN